jgi:hypothetical protein
MASGPGIVKKTAAAASTLITSTLFGRDASTPTSTATEGFVRFYKDASCQSPFSDDSFPLILTSPNPPCRNAPTQNLTGISLSALPTCPSYGLPLLTLFDGTNCESKDVPSITIGVTDTCENLTNGSAYSTAVSIGSVRWTCYSEGIPTMTMTAGQAEQTSSGSKGTETHCCSCCCNGCCQCNCVVM